MSSWFTNNFPKTIQRRALIIASHTYCFAARLMLFPFNVGVKQGLSCYCEKMCYAITSLSTACIKIWKKLILQRSIPYCRILKSQEITRNASLPRLFSTEVISDLHFFSTSLYKNSSFLSEFAFSFFACLFSDLLTLWTRKLLSCRNQSIDLLSKSMNWFLHHGNCNKVSYFFKTEIHRI